MDRLNLKHLVIVSLTLGLAACASPQPERESVGSVTKKVEPTAEKIEKTVQSVESVVPATSTVPADKGATTDEPIAESEVAAKSEVVKQEVNEPKKSEAKPVPALASESKRQLEAKKTPEPSIPIPTDPNTFLIQATQKNQTHPFYGIGDKRGFLVNGVQGKTLVLTRGEVYNFNIATGVQHDFYFSTSERGWGAGTVTDGIEGQFTYEGTVTVSPNPSTPGVMYYQCRNHKNMGGKIHVVNKGETVKLDAEPSGVAVDAKKPAFKVSEQQVKQKLAYAKMLMSSESAKRILGGDNAEAKALKGKAKDYVAKADSLLTEKNNVEAMAAVDEALRLINAANRLAPSTAVASEVDYKAQYENMLVEVEGYKQSYDKNIAKNGKHANATLDANKFDASMAQAKKLAAADDYEAALEPLQTASTMMTDVISVMLDDSVVVYDKEFSTPQEEYEYEVLRYEGYLELIPIAKEQRRPNAGQLQLMDQFVSKAEKIATEGADIAKKGDYKLAIQAYQAATSNVQRALMLVGVR